MKEPGIGGPRQLVGKRPGLFGRHVEPEDLYGDEPVSRWLVGPEYRAERPNTNLVQDPEWSECGRWSEGGRIVSGHSGEGQKNVTQIVRFSCRRLARPRVAGSISRGIYKLSRGVEGAGRCS